LVCFLIPKAAKKRGFPLGCLKDVQRGVPKDAEVLIPGFGAKKPNPVQDGLWGLAFIFWLNEIDPDAVPPP
jgi:hypothetical protein